MDELNNKITLFLELKAEKGINLNKFKSLKVEILELAINYVRKIAFLRAKNSSNYEDYVQEIMIELVKSLDSYEGKSQFITWLYSISQRTISRLKRREFFQNFYYTAPQNEHNSQTSSESFLYSKTNQGEAFKRLENLELVNFVKSLPERQRDVIMLFYFFDLSVEEVASSLKISEQAVKSSLFKGRQSLQRLYL